MNRAIHAATISAVALVLSCARDECRLDRDCPTDMVCTNIGACRSGSTRPPPTQQPPTGNTNRAPVARAGNPQMVAVGALVTLDGTASSDPDGDTLTYAWSFTSKPAGSGTALADAVTARARFIADVAGMYAVQLRVSDGPLSGAATTSVLAGVSNRPPTAEAGDNVVVQVGAAAMLDGSRSTDPEGAQLTYAWRIASAPNGSTAALQNAQMVRATLTPDVPGDYVVELVVNDGFDSSTPDTLTVTADPMTMGGTVACSTDSSLALNGDNFPNAMPRRVDYIHPGYLSLSGSQLWLGVRPTIRTATVVGIDFEADSPARGIDKRLEFNTTQLNHAFRVGRYTGATRAAFTDPGEPGLDVGGDGRGCNTITGEFTVNEFQMYAGIVERVSISFIQHCEGGIAELRGCVRYVAPNPLSNPRPPPANATPFDPREVYLIGSAIGQNGRPIPGGKVIAHWSTPAQQQGILPDFQGVGLDGTRLISGGGLYYVHTHPEDGKDHARRFVADSEAPMESFGSLSQYPYGHRNDGWLRTLRCDGSGVRDLKSRPDGSLLYFCHSDDRWYEEATNQAVVRAPSLLRVGPMGLMLLDAGNTRAQVRTSTGALIEVAIPAGIRTARSDATGFKVVTGDLSRGPASLIHIDARGGVTQLGTYPVLMGATFAFDNLALAGNDDLFYVARRSGGSTSTDIVVRSRLNAMAAEVVHDDETSTALNDPIVVTGQH